MNTQYLSITWSVSRGRDTYGYNICKLSAGYNGQVYRTCGGGYDMVGTVVGDWLQATYRERLLKIANRAHALVNEGSYSGTGYPDSLYGMTYHMAVYVDGLRTKDHYISLDGACGMSAVQTIAEAIGISLTATCNRKAHVTGYMVTDYGSAEALKAAQK